MKKTVANDVTFCFLVTTDLVKEHIWREWFDQLQQLQFKFKIIVHCSPSNVDNVKSDWLKLHFIPNKRTRDTAWGWVLKSMMSMYEHAIDTCPAAWYTLHSETCVPMVSPETFIRIFNEHKQHTFVSHRRAWWNILKVRRANLHLLPSDMHVAHSQWCIFCHEDLSQLVKMSKLDEHIKNALSVLAGGHAAEESYAAALLGSINDMKNVINQPTTLVDWNRSLNGNNPHVFIEWTDADETIVNDLRKTNANTFMFMRKIGPTFPDEILRKHIFDEQP